MYVAQSEMKSHGGGGGGGGEHFGLMTKEDNCMGACLRVIVVVECQMRLLYFVHSHIRKQ